MQNKCRELKAVKRVEFDEDECAEENALIFILRVFLEKRVR